MYHPHHVLLADPMALSMRKKWLYIWQSESTSFQELYVHVVVELLLQSYVKPAHNTHPFLIRFAPVGLLAMVFNSRVTLIIAIHHPGANISCLELTVLSKSSFDQMHIINLPMSSPPTP